MIMLFIFCMVLGMAQCAYGIDLKEEAVDGSNLSVVSAHASWEAEGQWYRACVVTLNNLGPQDMSHVKLSFFYDHQPFQHTGTDPFSLQSVNDGQNYWTTYVSDWVLPIKAGEKRSVKIGFNFSDGLGNEVDPPQSFIINDQEDSPVEDTIPPSVPQNLEAQNIKPYSFLLAWSPSTDNVGVVGYNVHYHPVSQEDSVLHISTALTSIKIEGLEPEETYSCRVSAFDKAGNQSGLSERLSVITSQEGVTPEVTGRKALPYVDALSYPTPDALAMVGLSGVTGLFTGFVVARDKKACWGGYSFVYDSNTHMEESADATKSNYLRQFFDEHPDSIISIGGAAGLPMASIKGITPDELCNLYEGILENYGIKALDFDYEGGFLADTSALMLHTQATRKLLANRPTTRIIYTLPVDGSPGLQGFNYYGESFLTLLAEEAIFPNAVQCMLMEFGAGSSNNLFEASVVALEGAHAHMKKAFGHKWNDQEIWQHLGACPMFGKNNNGKVFTLENQKDLNAFCRQKGMLLMSGWSIDRDAKSMEGIDGHQPYDFSKEVAQFSLT
ncbi:hypothetical protein EIL50_01620 [bacterium NHP-B]|nr:hypothetical protein EIL50_01620 [bacterium NHP-B]